MTIIAGGSILVGPTWTSITPSGDATTDTANIRTAIAQGNLYLSSGQYFDDGSGTELMLVDKPIEIIGAGMSTFGTQIISPADMSATRDIIRIRPVGDDQGGYFGSNQQAQYEGKITPLIGGEGLKLRSFSLKNVNDAAAGRHGIHFDFSAQYPGWVSQCEISDLLIRPRAGADSWAIYLNNPLVTNAFFASTIEKCKLWAGIYMYRAGDSINIQKNQITGDNYSIFIDRLVPGASMMSIMNNNLTGYAGVVKLVSAPRSKIYHNNAELYPMDGVTPVAMYEIDVASTYNHLAANYVTMESENCEIVGNLGGVWNTISSADSIKLTRAVNTYIDHNELYVTGAGKYCCNITSGSTGTKWGNNNKAITGDLLLNNGVNTVMLT